MLKVLVLAAGAGKVWFCVRVAGGILNFVLRRREVWSTVGGWRERPGLELLHFGLTLLVRQREE